MDTDSVTVPLKEDPEEDAQEPWWTHPYLRWLVGAALLAALVLLALALAYELDSLVTYGASSGSARHEAHLFNFQERCPDPQRWFRGKCRDVH